jgi:HYDIN/CFA65/VesB-like, Ig-like domain
VFVERLSTALAGLGVLCALTSCGGAGVPGAPSQPPAPQITTSPISVDFGQVAVGGKGTQTITVKNTGTGALTISQASVAGSGFTLSGPSLPASLAAGQSATFNAGFVPGTAGVATGSVSIQSNASATPTTVTLSGTGVTRVLSFNPVALTFGNVSVGDNIMLPVLLTNTGTADVTISHAGVTGSGFSLTGPSTPVTLEPGKNTSFSVSFSPTTAAGSTGDLTVVSDARGSPFPVPLSGSGVTPHSVGLSWSPSVSVGVVGYNIYRSLASGGPYTKLNDEVVSGTTYTDTTVDPGLEYYYVATAVDSSGEESAYSGETQAEVRNP